MDLEKVGKKLKELREQQGYTIREVAEQVGIHFTYVSKIEKGQASSLDTLSKLCDFYHAPIQQILGDEIDLPEELKELGVEWISFAKEMKKQNLTPEEIKKYVDVVKTLKGLT